MVDVAAVKKFIRLDTDFEDDLIAELISIAVSYLSDALSNYKQLYENDDCYRNKADYLIKVLAAEMFLNRDGRNDPRNDFSYTVRTLLNQLQYYAEAEPCEQPETN